jgi:hypothetical protein
MDSKTRKDDKSDGAERERGEKGTIMEGEMEEIETLQERGG